MRTIKLAKFTLSSFPYPGSFDIPAWRETNRQKLLDMGYPADKIQELFASSILWQPEEWIKRFETGENPVIKRDAEFKTPLPEGAKTLVFVLNAVGVREVETKPQPTI